jgi:hypothetical protein
MDSAGTPVPTTAAGAAIIKKANIHNTAAGLLKHNTLHIFALALKQLR